ncbi:MAG: TIGR03435 family protein [Acidobacteriaceae bacterium]|jgi:uncharacterized protein (TIGR03435 family)
MIRNLCITLLTCGIAVGQSTTQPTATPQPAATSAKQITFEVASIRRNKTGIMGGSGPTDDGYSVRNYAPVLLIGMAYGVSEFQRIQGLPAWCNWGVEGYDIDAKVAEPDIAEWKKEVSKQFPAALRALLEDRFKLKAHFETRDAPGYELVVAKNGPKFKAATPDETYPNGVHDRTGKPTLGLRDKYDPGSDHGLLIGQSASMAQLAQRFSSLMNPILGRQVVDKTGLAGQYDFSMPEYTEWTSNHQTEEAAPSIFTTLEESLGLKLEPTKTPVEFLVIDHIERPSEN